ncbi:MAG: hypothetical protein KDB07_13745, partial [Planctomycetes bacterium]|nr:hypothetical protein [Planctomycetota bacterium]
MKKSDTEVFQETCLRLSASAEMLVERGLREGKEFIAGNGAVSLVSDVLIASLCEWRLGNNPRELMSRCTTGIERAYSAGLDLGFEEWYFECRVHVANVARYLLGEDALHGEPLIPDHRELMIPLIVISKW